MPIDDIYTVLIEPFAEKHYIKRFRKKYKDAWGRTWFSLENEFSMFPLLFDDGTASVIHASKGVQICKTKFRIIGMKQSKSGSGNRCIVAVHGEAKEVRVLLVYNKTDLSGSGNETAQWKRIIKQNYSEYTDMV